MDNHILAIDIGGSHIAAGRVNSRSYKLEDGSYKRVVLPSDVAPSFFCKQLKDLLLGFFTLADTPPQNIAVSVPGPFDYQNGISKILDVGKFENIFGFHLKQFILSEFEAFGIEKIRFYNDATSLLHGEIHTNNLRGRVLGLTLGTGFGSSFFENGSIIKGKLGIPENGFLYNQPIGNSIADDYFSSRWLIAEYEAICGKKIQSVKALAEKANEDGRVKDIFDAFARNLFEFLNPFLKEFKADTLLFGGGIVRANALFLPALKAALQKASFKPQFIISDGSDKPALIGAAKLFSEAVEISTAEITEYRKTSQFLAPLIKKKDQIAGYDIYPSHKLPSGKIQSGYFQLAEKLSNEKTIILDGYLGVLWENVIHQLGQAMNKLHKKLRFYNVACALKSRPELNEITAPFMGDKNSIFGKRYTGELLDFYGAGKLRKIVPEAFEGINIIYGCGASLSGWEGVLVYVDLPKNELQFRSRSGSVTNLGMDQALEPAFMYKRFYFIDWVVLNLHKKKILPKIDLFVDEQRRDEPVFTSGKQLRMALESMSKSFFRVRPWFEPGPWGGQWIKEKISGLAQEVPNYAWSFELIVPENGLLLESDGILLECSFDSLMFQNGPEVLGHAYETFKTEFPIRFDFLDTFDGGNLSVQCHPRPEYIKAEFGESFTQDETYYILDAEEDAEVYLGFQENIVPEEFRKALETSNQQGKKVDIKAYVQTHTSRKHDLFLIPGGTIHASGKNNLVLEISNTPYIFTFKMYDWLRLDLAGKPRPINIEHAFKNLYFDRKGKRIKEEFISKPEIIRQQEGNTIEHLPTHEDHFYDIRRLEIEKEIELNTSNKFYVNMLVDGKSVILKTSSGESATFCYAETFVLPAATGSYKLINNGTTPVKVVQAYIKDKIKI